MPRAGGSKDAGKKREKYQKDTPPQKPTKQQAARQQGYEDTKPESSKQGMKKPGSQNKRKR